MEKRGFCLSGAWSLGNLGDQVILRTMAEKLEEYFPGSGISAISLGENEDIDGVSYVPGRNIFALIGAMRRSRVLLSGGGSLLQDKTSRRSLWYYLGVLALGRLCGCRVVIFAAGVGPVEHPSSRRLTRWVLDHCVDEILLRDAQSARLLQTLGVRKNPRVTADVAHLYDAGGIREDVCLLCLRSDGVDAQALSKALGMPVEKLALGPGDPGRKATAEDLSRGRLVISQRLHGLILAGETALVGLDVDPKISAYCARVGAVCTRDTSVQGLVKAAERAAEQLPTLSGCRENAEENFRILRSIYEK